MAAVTTDYFRLAVCLARAEGEATLKRVAEKATTLRMRNVCGCSTYQFPHRPGSGACPGVPENYSTDPRPAWESEERRIFEAAEARAINNGFN